MPLNRFVCDSRLATPSRVELKMDEGSAASFKTQVVFGFNLMKYVETQIEALLACLQRILADD